ncbi:MAG: IS4 family transposase [Anaerolineae bacterium]
MKGLLAGMSLLIFWVCWSVEPAPVQASVLSEVAGLFQGAHAASGPGVPVGPRPVERARGWYPTPQRLPKPELWRPLRRRKPLSDPPSRRGRGKPRRCRRTGVAQAACEVGEVTATGSARKATPGMGGAPRSRKASRAQLASRAADTEGSLSEWVVEELASVKLGDVRLEKRLHLLVTQFAAHPTALIPQACEGDKAAMKAAYRFFDNPKASHGAILDGHRLACVDRIADEELVLVLQDTTSLDYTPHSATEQLGPLENRNCQGLFVHTALATSEAGVPLGILDQQVWTRDPAQVGQRHQRKQRPIQEKESFKWLKGLRASLKEVPANVCLVTVADREADIFDLFWDAEKHQTHLLVRSAWNRRLDTKEKDYVWEAVGRTPVVSTSTVEVGRGKDRLPRTATVAIRFTPVEVRPPKHRRHEPGLKPVRLTVIEVREIDAPPEVEKPLHWVLLTNCAVNCLEDATRCIRWYGLRWLVERYHFTLKSGCRIEDRQLRKGERLQRCLGVDAIVAWRLLWLTYQARLAPDAPCTVALETHEWQALYGYIHKTSTPPATPPTLNQALCWIAQIGGFLGRKHDGDPGVKVLWRGWQTLHHIAEIWRVLHPPSKDVGNV